jgi:capsid protein
MVASLIEGAPRVEGGLHTCPAVYNPPPRAEVDPLKAAAARSADLAMGRLSWPDMLAEIGKTADEQVADIAAALKLLDKIGFVADWDRRKVSKAGVGQADSATQPVEPEDRIQQEPAL